MSEIIIRKAVVADVVAMQRLINAHAEQGEMLSRALHELYEDIRDFNIAVVDGEIIGCAAVHVNWANLAEVKSVVVDNAYQGTGVGRRLVNAGISDARALGVAALYCLTEQPEFFRSLGFHEIERDQLPRKVWSECIRCAKFNDCTEIAMRMEILDTPATAPADPLTSLASMPVRSHGK